MHDKTYKIIVLTPIKNESWILNYFLTATSKFADSIIVADQNSDDDSVAICKQFEKVILIHNNSEQYDEAARQILLINKARELFPDERLVFFALDADEIITYSSLAELDEWRLIKSAPSGTSFLFEKPDILPGIKKCIRWPNSYFPIAFVDNGSSHQPSIIHSRRIPYSDPNKVIKIENIKFMHFAVSRFNAQSAKMRLYSMVENINSISPFYRRRRIYNSYFYPTSFYSNTPSDIPVEWVHGYYTSNVLLDNLSDPAYSWYDFEVLRIFKKYGFQKFYLDDIWKFNWKECLAYAQKNNIPGIPEMIRTPPWYYFFFTSTFDNLIKFYRRIKNR